MTSMVWYKRVMAGFAPAVELAMFLGSSIVLVLLGFLGFLGTKSGSNHDRTRHR
jgi:ABC-type multidrug transport system permease subunit